MNKKNFLNELKRFVELGIVDEGTYFRVENYYADERNLKDSINNFFLVLASVLIGLGLVLVFAYNWEKLGRNVKSLIVILLLLFSQGVTFFVRFYNARQRLYEAASIFQVLMVGTSIALVSQIYNISGEIDIFLLVWAILVTPIIYIMKTKFTYTVYQIIALSYYFENLNASKASLLVYFILVLIAYYLMHPEKILKALTIIFVLIAFSGFYLDLDMGWKLNLIYFITVFNIVYLRVDFLKRPAKTAVLGIIYFLTFKNYNIPTQNYYINVDFYMGAVILSALILFSVASIYKYKGKLRRDWVLSISQIIILFLFVPKNMYIAYNLYFAFVAVFYLLDSIKVKNIGQMNFSMFLITFLVVSRFFDQEIPILPRAAIFIVLGAAILAMNIYYMKKRGKYEE